jgi:uncharacterized membrane protein YgcG
MPVTSRLQIMVRNLDLRRAPKTRQRMALALSLVMIAGCATSSSSLNPFGDSKTPQEQAADIDPMLQAAGFSALPATTPEQEARLQALPPLKLSYYDDTKGVRHYWLADPDVCKCIFHGDEASYQRYENQVADRDRHAVEMQQQQQMMGNGFGPPGMGFGGGGSGFSFGGGGFGMSF